MNASYRLWIPDLLDAAEPAGIKEYSLKCTYAGETILGGFLLENVQSGYTRSSLKVIIFERTIASHPMICKATGSTREESMAMTARFFEVRDSSTMVPFAAIMA